MLVRYLLCLLPCLLIQDLLSISPIDGVWDALLYISTIRYYISHSSYWFVAAIIPLYFLSPWFYVILKRGGLKAAVSIILLLFVLHCIPVSQMPKNLADVVNNIQFVLLRSCSFILGMVLGSYVKNNRSIPLKINIMLFVSGIICVLIFSGKVYGYVFWVIPILCILVFLLKLVNEKIRICMSFFGKISLESYIFNGALPKVFIALFLLFDVISLNNFLPYLVACVAGLCFSYLCYLLASRILDKYVG